MAPPTHPPFEGACESIEATRVFNGHDVFDVAHTLERFETLQRDSDVIRAPCPAGSDSRASSDPPGHTNSVMIAVDGACRNNGQPNAIAASAVYLGPGSPFNETYVLHAWPAPTSQRAELTAGIKALEAAMALADDWGEYPEHVVIKTDSAYLFNGATDWIEKWERRGWTTAKGTDVVNKDLFQQLESYIGDLEDEGTVVQFFQVPRNQNKDADLMANQALNAEVQANEATRAQATVEQDRMHTSGGRPTIVNIALNKEPWFDEMFSNMLRMLKDRAHLLHATNSVSAASWLASDPPPAAVLVTDAGIVENKGRPAAEQLIKYVSKGGTAVFCGVFSSFMTPDKLQSFFSAAFGLPWKSGRYSRDTFRINPAAAAELPNPSFKSGDYNVKALHLQGVDPSAALYPAANDAGPLQTAVAWQKVGRGRVGYLGDVNAEQPTDRIILAMCGV